MAKISKTAIDKNLRDRVFAGITGKDEYFLAKLVRINDRQYGAIMKDMNGEMRYVRIGAIVAELRDDMTAEELMQSEINAYQVKQDEKAIKALKKEQKIAKDKARREAEAKAKAEEVSAS